MRTVELGHTGITSSVLGFGCSAVMGRSGRRDSLRALSAAWEAGITFFDTARCYGYGESEALLGQFLRTRRDKAVISTKFGIVPSVQSPWKRVAKPLARAVLGLAPVSRSLLLRMASGQVTRAQFSVEALHQSLHDSLRALQTDYVDLLFMHDATIDALDREDLLDAMERLVASGKVRAAGVSGEPPVIEAVLGRQPGPLRALQFPCNVFDFSCSSMFAKGSSGFATVANHPFGGVERVSETRETLRRLAATPAAPAAARDKLEPVDDAVLADVTLNAILSGPGIHVVIPAMMDLSHLRDNVVAVTRSRFSSDEIAWLRAAIAAESRSLTFEAI